ncbi:DNA methylase [Porphyromonas gingivalis]|uniref:DNA methylase n=1 Tax=Porphyromonas gingivalis TaxID=837 RepID=UPI000C19DAB4|nr:DNA methylase [Porphyromonas gingivalis]ATS02971.1 DNA methylase [Porphyromonas gingivalis]
MQAAPQGGIYNYFHSLLPPLSLAPFLPRTPLYSISLFFKGLINRKSPLEKKSKDIFQEAF